MRKTLTITHTPLGWILMLNVITGNGLGALSATFGLNAHDARALASELMERADELDGQNKEVTH